MSYAEPDSRLLGGIPVTNPADLKAFFDDAADEIDAAIGFIYQTPVTTSAEGGSLPRPVSLILTRINRYLATGRYITAVAAGGEDSGMHAYGRNMINEARAALNLIATGTTELDALRIQDPDRARRAPGIKNAEAQSNVDAFYGAYTSGSSVQGMIFDPNFPRSIGEREAEWTRGW